MLPALLLAVLVAAAAAGCGSESRSPAAPTAADRVSPAPPAGRSVSGVVYDTAARPIASATVEVLDGPQAGMSTMSDGRGQFSMTGGFDESTRFRATADGHATSIRTLQPFCAQCPANWWVIFILEVPDPPVSIGGDYTLSFVAGAACTMLPDDMRSRAFTATIPETSPALPDNPFFRVGGATFVEHSDAMSIGVAGSYVSFGLDILVEQIAPNTFLVFGGQAAGVVDTANPSTIVLPFDGSIDYCVTFAERGRYQDCYQGRAELHRCQLSHQLTLRRR
jgi:hypothetical protein